MEPPREERLLHKQARDPYKTPLKLPEGSTCPRCGAVYHEGQWQWLPQTSHPHQEICPACHRVEDHYPAGVLELKGGFVVWHKDDILRIIHSVEAMEKAEHPLRRIMAIEEAEEGMVVNTTDVFLPWHIAEALKDTHGGELEFQYDKEGYFIRVNWKRHA